MAGLQDLFARKDGMKVFLETVINVAMVARGKAGKKAECLEYINQVWTDMRPLSLRYYGNGQGISDVTPARSAMALMVVRAGPTSRCSATIASTIRCRVSASRSARRFF